MLRVGSVFVRLDIMEQGRIFVTVTCKLLQADYRINELRNPVLTYISLCQLSVMELAFSCSKLTAMNGLAIRMKSAQSLLTLQ